jgi:hypothetical protein
MVTVQDVASDPELYRQCLAASASIDMVVAEAGESAVVDALQPLLLMWPPKDLPAEKLARDAWWIIYRRALKDLPLEALKAGIERYIQTTTYKVFPAPGEIRKLAEPKKAELFRIWSRVKMVTKQPAPKPPVSDEERERVKAQMAALAADLGRKSAAPADVKLRPDRERAAVVRESYETVARLEAEKAAGGAAPAS